MRKVNQQSLDFFDAVEKRELRLLTLHQTVNQSFKTIVDHCNYGIPFPCRDGAAGLLLFNPEAIADDLSQKPFYGLSVRPEGVHGTSL